MARGQGTVWQSGRVWWVQYYHAGRRFRESSGSERKTDAIALLRRRLEEAGRGRPRVIAEAVLLTDLKTMLDADYRLNDRRSTTRRDQAWTHVAETFGPKEKAVTVTPHRLARYVEARTDKGAKAATIRYELALLKRAFNLARRAGSLRADECPASWPTINPDNRRKGFFEDRDLDQVIAKLPADVGDVVEFLRWSGWRKGEALGLRWSEVDEKAGVIRIETTKSGAARTLPYHALPALKALIEHRRKVTDAVQKKRHLVVPWVFHRNGEQVGSFGKSWSTACRKAGVPGRLVHDLRRTAARNLSRAGVPERVVMDLCGWKTRSVFDRYNIVNEDDLANGLAKLAAPKAARSS